MIKDVKDETVANFLVQEIFIYYGSLKELLSDNITNSLTHKIEYYLRKLHTQNRYIIAYQPRTNGKVENLNDILGNILIKYFTSKSTKLWYEYLPQALFATRIQVYNISKYSSYYLLYSQYLY